MDLDIETLKKMTASEIKAHMGESFRILQEKEAQDLIEEKKRKRREYDRKRKSQTFALTSRVPTREDAEAVRNLVKKAQELAKKNGWSLAEEINTITADLPQSRRRNRPATKTQAPSSSVDLSTQDSDLQGQP